jgi:hypothetical protein
VGRRQRALVAVVDGHRQMGCTTGQQRPGRDEQDRVNFHRVLLPETRHIRESVGE